MYQNMKPEEDTFKVEAVRKVKNAQEAISFLISIEAADR